MIVIASLRRLGAIAAFAASAFASLASANDGPGLDVVPATLIEQRVLAQHALSIGLSTEILESQVTVFTGLLIYGADGQCHSLSGGGSIRVVNMHYDPSGSPFGGRVQIFFTATCKSLYIDESVNFTRVGVNYRAAPVMTMYSRAGAKTGTLNFTETIGSGAGGIKVSGTGTFTPVNGTGKLSIGLVCQIPLVNQAGLIFMRRAERLRRIVQYLDTPRDTDIACSGGVAQTFPLIAKSVASLTPITLHLTTVGANTKVTFKQTAAATLVTGALNALTIKLNALGQVIVSGTKVAYGHDTFSGQAASLTLFPPKPTTWSVVDSAHSARIIIVLTDNTTRKLTGSVTGITGTPVLATILLDQSGTGTITYSNAVKAAILSWEATN